MTFCFFTTQYLPTPGGVERYTWNLARRCLAAGHRALVVTSSLPGLPARETDADGIEIWRLPAWPVMNGRFPVLKPHPPAADLWAQGIDFAVIQTRMYAQSVWAARQCKRRSIPALVLDHSTGYMMHGGAAGPCGQNVRAPGLQHYQSLRVPLLRRLRRCLQLAAHLRHHRRWPPAQRRGPGGTGRLSQRPPPRLPGRIRSRPRHPHHSLCGAAHPRKRRGPSWPKPCGS